MRLRARILAAGALAAAALAPASAAQAKAPALLVPSSGAAYPLQTLVVALPGGAPVWPGSLTLRENGVRIPARDVSATPATQVPGAFGTILVLNASRGVPAASVRAQLAAARAFVARRAGSIPVGIVTYNGVATVLAPPTTDRRILASALKSAPPRLGGSHVYDAVDVALGLLRSARVGSGAVVALAAGRDSGSRVTPAQLGAAARAQNARVFAAGLGSPGRAAAALDGLAATGVAHSFGTPRAAALPGLLSGFGAQLGRASVVRYTSDAGAGNRVAISLDVNGVAARTAATLPAAPHAPKASAPAAKPHASPVKDFFASAQGRTAVVLAVIALLFFGFGPLFLLAQRTSVQSRVSEYAGDLPGDALEDEVETAEPRRLPWASQLERLGAKLELARVELSPGRVVAYTALAALVLGWMVGAAAHAAVAAIIVFGLVPLGVRFALNLRIARERAKFADQLADQLQATASAMRAGHSFAGALATLVEDAAEPSATEFARVVADERLGIPLEDAFKTMIERMQNRDLEQVALVATLQRETGGNGAEALDRVVENLRGRDEVRRLVASLTAQGRMSRWVLTGIPIGLGLALSFMGGDYMRPLFHTGVGLTMVCLACLMVAAGSYAIGKLVDIDV
jgi:tight adherence protein B